MRDLNSLSPVTILERLDWRARTQPERLAFAFLYDDSKPPADSRWDRWSYSQLQYRALAVAQLLSQEHSIAVGERLLLVYPAGLDFVAAFYGCLYAGVVPVPVPPPKRKQGLDRWRHAIANAQIKGALTTSELHGGVRELLDESEGSEDPLLCLVAASTDPDQPFDGPHYEPPLASNDPARTSTLAFLQYTSGSTSQPKGVMVSHKNILANMHQIERGFGALEEDRVVSWLPHYHDMGLIGSILSPVYSGYEMTLMAPGSFLRKPLRWLETVTYVKATGIGGPNFAYEYCLSKATDEQLSVLDLSHLKLVFNGAETVRSDTLARFTDTFSRCGFRAESFYPCFGMAEATLFVTGSPLNKTPKEFSVDRRSLLQFGHTLATPGSETIADNYLTHIVSCGHAVEGLTLCAVDPETYQLREDGQVGEIWFAGENVAMGYWELEQATQESFQAVIRNSDKYAGQHFFRTGDLGFMYGGELYITGRLKQLIIIRGENYYPQDIEATVTAVTDDLVQGACAAFSQFIAGEERLSLVVEVERRALRKIDVQAVIAAVRTAVATHHDLQLGAITLIKPGRLPKTPSGKIQHHACRDGVENNRFDCVGQWQFEIDETSRAAAVDEHWLEQLIAMSASRRRLQLRLWLQDLVSEVLSLPENQPPSTTENFFDLGLDSVMLVNLKDDIEMHLDMVLPATLVFLHPSIDSLSVFLSDELNHNIPTIEEAEPGNEGDKPKVSPLAQTPIKETDGINQSIENELAALDELLQ